MQQIRAPQLAAWLADESLAKPLLLDVREPWEIEMCSLPGAQHIPMHLIPMRCNELDPDQEIVVICHHGARSMQVALFLEGKGYAALHNLAGGVEAWATEVDPTMRRY
ncbi:MAG: sulfurtransferase [Betaproteobacteria bacterium HGW-Betaproteobacteria-10]|nr:MAG: sulfurtransferase [Betaproteobacteria bacterium HGW-Betaproteobacteria-10]